MGLFKHKYFKPIVYAISGALIGYAFYYYYGCTNGCPLSSNWYITTAYGLVSGILIGLPAKQNNSEDKA